MEYTMYIVYQLELDAIKHLEWRYIILFQHVSSFTRNNICPYHQHPRKYSRDPMNITSNNMSNLH